MTEPLPPGSVIGILGGGQLGRMLSVAASRLGFRTHVFEPDANAPAGHVAERVTTADYADTDSLIAFGRSVDVITYEFENIPTDALDELESTTPIRPGREALRVSQDRISEKDFLRTLGLTVAPYAEVHDVATMAAALEQVGTPSILKTRRFGYDGKGQVRLSRSEDAARALAEVAGAPSVLEGLVYFEREISVIAARGSSGEVVCFDPGENVHVDGILRSTSVPADISAALATSAVDIATSIVNALHYVGVLGVELFVTRTGLLVNEIAPRVHNSGHWTQNVCAVDQFEQHIRAIAGWPLGSGARYGDVVMENLIGDDVDLVLQRAAAPGSALHLYGKAEARPGRKMGHVNMIRSAERTK